MTSLCSLAVTRTYGTPRVRRLSTSCISSQTPGPTPPDKSCRHSVSTHPWFHCSVFTVRLGQARPVAIPRPPSMTQSSGTLNFPPSPSHSINSLPDCTHIPEANGSCQDTPVRALNLDGMQTEPEPELLMSPVPTYNEYER